MRHHRFMSLACGLLALLFVGPSVALGGDSPNRQKMNGLLSLPDGILTIHTNQDRKKLPPIELSHTNQDDLPPVPPLPPAPVIGDPIRPDARPIDWNLGLIDLGNPLDPIGGDLIPQDDEPLVDLDIEFTSNGTTAPILSTGTIPGPGALPLLALAGLGAGRRRRRD